jgi:large subunit ribosomal protein L4
MKLKVFNSEATQSTERDFPLPLFEGDRGLQAVKEVVIAHRANARQGTHATKRRGEVRGGGKKPWNQKGTGRARAGSIRSPLWVGGGVVFGPQPRDYSKKINGKVKTLAFSRALYDRAVAGDIALIESVAPAQSKTKVMGQIIDRVAPIGHVLVVDDTFTPAAARAARNLERVTMQEATKLNTLDLCTFTKIVMSTKALEKVLTRATGGQS